jgi:hypothetical protein
MSFLELFHLFSQIPGVSSIKALILNAGFTPKVIFRQPVILNIRFLCVKGLKLDAFIQLSL